MCYQNPTVWYEVTVRGIATSLTNAVWSITITQLLRFKFQFRLQLHRQTFIRSFKRPCFKLIAQVSIFFHLGWQDSIRISFNVALRLQSFWGCQLISLPGDYGRATCWAQGGRASSPFAWSLKNVQKSGGQRSISCSMFLKGSENHKAFG